MMTRLYRNIIYQGKNAFREKTFVFWSVLYPLMMAVFFYIAFSGILDRELEVINLGISKENPIENILEEVEIFNLHIIDSGEANSKLQDEDIYGYIDNDLNLLVKESGLNQTIIKEVVDQIVQTSALNIPLDRLDFSVDYTISRNQPADPVVIIFYSLIAMVSTYAIYSGIEVVSLTQANLSEVAKRINISPIRKSDFLLAGVIVGLFVNILSNALLLSFIHFVLDINLFTEIKYSLSFIILGNLFGISLGILIGCISKAPENKKTIIGVATTLFLAFLSGLMSPDIKVMVDKKFPIINMLNPVAIITDNLYKVNQLGIMSSVKQDIITIAILSFLLILASIAFLRRKSYDSL